MLGCQYFSATFLCLDDSPRSIDETVVVGISVIFIFIFPFRSFNRSVWYKTGGQIGREARATMNAGNA